MTGKLEKGVNREDNITRMCQELNEYGSYIELTFDNSRGHLITPSYIENIIVKLGELQKVLKRKNLIKSPLYEQARSIKNSLYAAITLYDEPKNRSYYFDQIENIASALKYITPC